MLKAQVVSDRLLPINCVQLILDAHADCTGTVTTGGAVAISVLQRGLPGAAGRGSEDRNDPSDESGDSHQEQERERRADGEDGQDAVLRGEPHHAPDGQK